MPNDKPKELIPLSTQFYQIQQQAQQQVLQESIPLHTTIQLSNIELQDDNLLQSFPPIPTAETSKFQQVPIFEFDNIDNTVLDKNSVEQTDESFKNQDSDSLALIPANVSNTLTYHQLQGVTQLQFIISLSQEISQLLDSNIPHQLSISYNTTNIHNVQLAQLYNMLSTPFSSYVNSSNIGADLPSLEEQEDQDIKPLFIIHINICFFMILYRNFYRSSYHQNLFNNVMIFINMIYYIALLNTLGIFLHNL